MLAAARRGRLLGELYRGGARHDQPRLPGGRVPRPIHRRRAEVIALEELHAAALEQGRLGGGLDALGDGRQAEAVGEPSRVRMNS